MKKKIFSGKTKERKKGRKKEMIRGKESKERKKM